MNGPTAKSRLVSGIFWMTAAKGFAQAISWVITIAVVRLLAPQDYGLMGMATLLSGFLFLFSELGLGAAIIQKADLRDDHLSHLRWVIAGISVLMFVLLILAAPAVALYFNEPRLTNIVRVLSFSFLAHAAGNPSASLLQRRMAFREKAAAEFAGSIAGAVTTLILAVLGFAVWSLVIGYLAQQYVMNALYVVYAPVRVRGAFTTSGLREFFNFGWQVALSRVLWWVASNADFMVVGRVLGSVQLGYYSLAFQFSSMPIDKLVTIINQVAYPSFAAVQHDDETARRHYLKLVSGVALLTFPMFIGLLLVADAAVSLFFTSKWLPVVVPLKILCIVSCMRAIEILNTPLVVAKGKPGIVLGNSLAQAILLPAAVYIGAQYGLYGVALAWLITRPVLFGMITRRALDVIGIGFTRYVAALAHPILGCVLMAVVVLPTQKYVLVGMRPALQVAITCVLGLAAYVGYNLLCNSAAIGEGLEIIRARFGRKRVVPAAAMEAAS